MTFLAVFSFAKGEALDNAFDLTIEEGDQEFGKIEAEDILDLDSLQTEDWKGAQKFLNFCQKNDIQEHNKIHRFGFR